MKHDSPISDDLALHVEAMHDGERPSFKKDASTLDPVAIAYQDELADLRSRLRSIPAESAGAGLRKRIEDEVVSKKKGAHGRLLLAIAAAALLVFATASFLVPFGGSDVEMYVDDLVQRRQVSSVSTFTTNDRGELQSLLAQKADFLPVIPQFKGVALVSGQLCKVDGSPVALIDWKLGSGDLTLYISPTDKNPRGVHQQSLAGYSTCTWRVSGLEYVLIGPGNEAIRLHKLAETARQQHSSR